MKIRLAYGRCGLDVELPDSAQVIHPHFVPGLPDEAASLLAALRDPIQSPPLISLVKPGDKVVVAHSDMTRATPNDRILPVILAELEGAGVRREDITLLCALGTHRRHTAAEMRALLGDRVVDCYRCVQHDAYDDSILLPLGETRYGHPVRLNRLLVEADVRILTGFIEPHFFAGFSGGPKCVLPGLSGSESVVTNHSVEFLAHPMATWGITEGNPLWEEMLETALRLNPVFLLNVTLNVKGEITGVFAGDLRAAHKLGCEFVRQHAMIKVDAPFDVVLTTNNGYPLDQNLYQAGKGMNAAWKVVRKGGAIVVASACEDGIPDGSHYEKLVSSAGSLEGMWALLKQPGFSAPEQWGMQIQAMIQNDADVYIYSDGLTDEKIHRMLFSPCRDIEATIGQLMKKHGNRLCVLPEGPQVIAYL